ncbi:helix-turn-helix domain-containing protein [Microbacterium sufflavum]|uniref:Helix-turn-helix domain-containing protein n=1 Tax=Microbacterium sufflavum TaxID=2851649 RepID=A0ABY4IB08_9MICO|nr:helix-turn-helix transcriptional regulator [Microbacterium sufflavum]MPS75411.1 XRE family transcriptional regulator [Microbacterium sp.]UPL09945.1 helix-turn-helix domain-containing protein [Microbacterium sufflavum]
MTHSAKQDFGDFVAEHRRGTGLTQRELASMLHVTESAVSKWERGLSYPDISLLPALARELDVGCCWRSSWCSRRSGSRCPLFRRRSGS